MSAIEIVVVIGLIGYIIFRQVQGEPLRGKRAVLLPAILTLVGFSNLRSGGGQLTSADILCLVIGTAGSAAIGVAFGAVTRLESRGGHLWAQLPLRGLWLWAALIGWRVLVMVLATGMHAHVAASTSTLLLSLGINRLAQAAVIVPRAIAMGVPFAPEKDGKVFMADTFSRGGLGDRLGGGLGGPLGGRDDLDDDYGDDRYDIGDRYGDDRYDIGDRYGDGFRRRDHRPGRDHRAGHGGRGGRPQSWSR
jgi:hypothetical protein